MTEFVVNGEAVETDASRIPPFFGCCENIWA